MLYIHGGWPKTGTTSLQRALAVQQDRLATGGYLYPDEWQGYWGGADHSHHALVESLKDRHGSARAVEDLERLLADHPAEDVVISCENLTLLLDLHGDCGPLQEFLAAARQMAPVTCIWTLRRFDELRRSLYLQFVSIGHVPSGPIEFMRERRAPRLFARLRELEGRVDEVVYLEYAADGSHNHRLLRALAMGDELLAALDRELVEASQLNRSLSHKQAVALLNFDALSERAGTVLDKEALWEGLRNGAIRFKRDRRCDLVEAGVRRSLHEEALQAARDCGVSAYVDFFSGDTIDDSAGAVRMTPDVLDPDDLDLLVATCAHTTPA